MTLFSFRDFGDALPAGEALDNVALLSIRQVPG
jgi:hypothetical protein